MLKIIIEFYKTTGKWYDTVELCSTGIEVFETDKITDKIESVYPSTKEFHYVFTATDNEGAVNKRLIIKL